MGGGSNTFRVPIHCRLPTTDEKRRVGNGNEAPIRCVRKPDICRAEAGAVTDQLIFAREKEHLFKPPEMSSDLPVAFL